MPPPPKKPHQHAASTRNSSPTTPSHRPFSSLAAPPSSIPHSLQSNTTAAPISIDEDSDDLPRNLNPEPPKKNNKQQVEFGFLQPKALVGIFLLHLIFQYL